MGAHEDGAARQAVRRAARPLTGHAGDYDALLGRIGDARVVLLGEASHGTHEFYRERARITQRLVAEKGFTVVAVEADWPDALRVGRWVRGQGADGSAAEALDDFRRFPTWMWRNADVLAFVDWLREYNAALVDADARRVGFYGMDMYSLSTSIQEVLRYLDETDPEAAQRARYRYGCFEQFGEDPQAYGYAAEMGLTTPCQEHAVQQLVEMQRRAGELAARGGAVSEDEHFFAEQNARLVASAEEYYRGMFGGRVNTWNLRDRHMADTLDALIAHFDRHGGSTRVVVWAHNSHLGDASATQMGREGEWNVGQLARERWGDDAVLVGFTTYTGTVTAASDWDGPAERKRVVPALPESWESLFHETGLGDFTLDLGDPGVAAALAGERLERAIGVIYLPRTERVSHYFSAALAEQFDVVVHLDTTRAVEPLDDVSVRGPEDVPDTFPSGL